MKYSVRFIMGVALIGGALPTNCRDAQAVKRADGITTVQRSCCLPGPIGPQGRTGLQGEQGPAGTSGISAYADYVFIGGDANTNMSVDDPFLIDTDLFVMDDVTTRTENGGTIFTFAPGVYVLDYETSIQPILEGENLVLGASIAVYRATVKVAESVAGNALTIGEFPDPSTIDWVHGRHIIEVEAEEDVYIGTTIGVNNVTVATTATLGVPLVRLSILKLA